MNRVLGRNDMKKNTIRNSCLLVITALIWGIAFVAQSAGGDMLGPYVFNCIRSLIGAIVLVPVIFLLDRLHLTSKKPISKEDHRRLWKGGVCCGIALCIASNVQQLGLYFGTSSGKAGFLTACYILLVPILGLFLKKRIDWNIWVGVLLALVGLSLLCMKGSFSIQFSDGLLLLCALGFAVHILVIDYFSPLVDGVRMSCIQFFVCGILTGIPAFWFDMKHSLEGIRQSLSLFTTWDVWIPVLYAGIMSCGVAYTLQIIGQNGVNPTIASLLMSLESVFAVLAGWLILNEALSRREMMGCVLIFVAIVLAQIPVKSLRWRNRKKKSESV